ncbi:MAG: Trm112 family protein [Candidatus Lokiarchaeota archaeon]|nr:Trm112 family protein [Candidatus Lokiarchaeota archaeon]
MSRFFNIFTYTPWDNPQINELSEVRLLSIMDIYNKYPVIEAEFFDDLKSNIKNFSHYESISTIKRIIGPNLEDYSIQDWIFIWVIDLENRFYQFLIQKTNKDNDLQGILVALAPPELVQLFSKFKKEAILKTFSLINNPKEIKFLKLLTSQGKSIAEDNKKFQIKNKDLQKINLVNYLKNTPNVSGQWFPNYSPKCPICNGILTELKEYKVGFGKLVCPQCGYHNK